MTGLNIPAARAALRAMWDAAGERAASGERGTPWDEGHEARVDQIAQSYDDETGRFRPLRPRRDR